MSAVINLNAGENVLELVGTDYGALLTFTQSWYPQGVTLGSCS